STRTDATRPHRAARAPALPCRSNRRPQSASAATAGKLAATALRRSFRSQPSRYALAPRSSKRCYVAHRMRLGYFEDVERIEYRRITFRNVPVRIQEIQDAAPIRTPLRRQVENIGRDALHTVRKIIVLREEVPGAIQRRLRIRERDRCASRDLARECQELGRIQKLEDAHRVNTQTSPQRVRIGEREAVEHILEAALCIRLNALVQQNASGFRQESHLLLRDVVSLLAVVEVQLPRHFLDEAAIGALRAFAAQRRSDMHSAYARVHLRDLSDVDMCRELDGRADFGLWGIHRA